MVITIVDIVGFAHQSIKLIFKKQNADRGGDGAFDDVFPMIGWHRIGLT